MLAATKSTVYGLVFAAALQICLAGSSSLSAQCEQRQLEEEAEFEPTFIDATGEESAMMQTGVEIMSELAESVDLEPETEFLPQPTVRGASAMQVLAEVEMVGGSEPSDDDTSNNQVSEDDSMRAEDISETVSDGDISLDSLDSEAEQQPEVAAADDMAATSSTEAVSQGDVSLNSLSLEPAQQYEVVVDDASRAAAVPDTDSKEDLSPVNLALDAVQQPQVNATDDSPSNVSPAAKPDSQAVDPSRAPEQGAAEASEISLADDALQKDVTEADAKSISTPSAVAQDVIREPEANATIGEHAADTSSSVAAWLANKPAVDALEDDASAVASGVFESLEPDISKVDASKNEAAAVLGTASSVDHEELKEKRIPIVSDVLTLAPEQVDSMRTWLLIASISIFVALAAVLLWAMCRRPEPVVDREEILAKVYEAAQVSLRPKPVM